jgi:CHAD domain-containing protein
MVAKRAVRKQQDSSRPAHHLQAHHLQAPDPLAHLLPVANAFNAALTQGIEDAAPEAVHAMRTGSRRLQAMLEARLREGGPAGQALERGARAWLRELKQVRRGAGAVRDLDVQRKLLEDWVGKQMPEQGGAADGGGASLPAEIKQAETLDAWLKSERKHLARGMQKQIRKRQRGLAEGQVTCFAAITRAPLGRPGALRTADGVALEDFVRAVDAMPLLHGENLHDFRKATKKARYVAEAGANSDSSVARALKRIQDAIGEWHDWLCLGEEAEAALGQDGPELTAAIQREIERHFGAALKTTQSLRGRLLGEWMAAESPRKRASRAAAPGDHRIVSNQRTA